MAPKNATKMAEWDAHTKEACMASLMALNGTAGNPTGLAICYNLPYLNNATGLFQADLRLYRVAPATGNWVGIPDEDVKVDLSYKDAWVNPEGNTMTRRTVGLEGRADAPAPAAASAAPSPMTPKVLKGFNFVGTMNPDLVSKALNL